MKKKSWIHFYQLLREGNPMVNGNHQNNCMFFSLYRGPTDPIDVITFSDYNTKRYQIKLNYMTLMEYHKAYTA